MLKKKHFFRQLIRESFQPPNTLTLTAFLATVILKKGVESRLTFRHLFCTVTRTWKCKHLSLHVFSENVKLVTSTVNIKFSVQVENSLENNYNLCLSSSFVLFFLIFTNDHLFVGQH